MTDTIGSAIAQRVQGTHKLMLEITSDLTDAQLAHQPGPDAPPIGWHLWHAARFADRLQASFHSNATMPGQMLDLSSQLWLAEGLAPRWGLDPATLGLYETGMGMSVDVAVSVARVGREVLLDYANRTFTAVEAAIAAPDVARLESPRISVREYRLEGNTIVAAPGAESTVGSDLIYYLAHIARHAGNAEALRGAVLGIRGI